MSLWERFYTSFSENASETAFCIGNRYYSYSEFTRYTGGSQQLLLNYSGGATGLPVGVMCHDTVETFAAIFAIWFSGCHFVPLHPLHPVFVNQEKIRLAKLQIIMDSDPDANSTELKAECICTKNVTTTNSLFLISEQERAYILFTSGSTGKPKGVPISVKNLDAFTTGFLELYPDLTSSDRFLQTYDLTSDAAFTGYLIPLLLGATVFTIPAGSFKYLAIVKILQEHRITWTQFTPSVLNYLRPYFKSMRFDSLKHTHFGGEALPFELVAEWADCVPNAELSNIYGPTETTITCTILRTNIRQLKESVYNGIVSIGKPLKGVKILIIGETGQIVGDDKKGELCIGGSQVMEGYLSRTADDNKTFFMHEENGNREKYYRSGDLVIRDRKGYLHFCGRKDDQLKISGYRIEPAEIEWAVSQVTGGSKSKACGYRKTNGTVAIVVFTENQDSQPEILKDKLRSILPPALIPEKIISIRQFPLNSNGKVDLPGLIEEFSNQLYD